MKCPRCGYVSFDHNLECPRCRSDISAEQRKMNLPTFEPFPPSLFKTHAGDSSPLDNISVGDLSHQNASTEIRGEVDKPVAVDLDCVSHGQRMAEAEGGKIFEGAGALEVTSDLPGPRSYFSRHKEEIEEFLSEFLPERGKDESDSEMGDSLVDQGGRISVTAKWATARDREFEESEYFELDLDEPTPGRSIDGEQTEDKTYAFERAEGVALGVDRKKLAVKDT